MIAAERDHFGAGADDFCGVGFQRVGEVFLAAPIEEAIAVVDDSQGVEGIEHPRPERTPGIFGRGLANAFRAQAGAGAVGHGLIKGNAGDRNINACEIAGIFAAHEGKRAGIGCFPVGCP